MIRKYLIYILLIFLFTECSDVLDYPESNRINSNGEVQLSFYIPGLIVRKTRSGSDPECRIDDISVIVYDEENNDSPVQTEKVFIDASKNLKQSNRLQLSDDNKLILSFRLNEELRGRSGLKFYFLSNCDESFENIGINEDDFQSGEVTSISRHSEGVMESLIMTGMINQEDILKNHAVPLYRNAAKITVSDKVPSQDTETIEMFPYRLYGDASQSPRMAYNRYGECREACNSVPDATDIFSPEATFVHATKNVLNDNEIGGKLFVITKLNYDGNDYFYRLDFVNEDQTEYLDTKPNHWYQFIILDVSCAGYATPEEAALHPNNGLKYKLHDHSPISYNMTSDGFRELGVSHTIEYNGLPNTDDAWSDKELFIKFFSKDSTEEPKTPEEVGKCIEILDPSWLQISEAELITDDAYTGISYGDDDNDRGTVYRLKLRFLNTDDLGAVENTVSVSWNGLKREVPVTWIRNFSGSDITSTSLTMHYDSQNTIIENYWEFLSSSDNATTGITGALWGVQTSANNGKIRNQGFHFPVMYGASGNLATYSYVITFDKLEKLKKDNIESVVISNTDSHISCIENDNNDKPEYLSYKLTRDNLDGYDYTTGNISFNITLKDGSTLIYTFHTYHTGFFHIDSQKHRLDTKDDKNYYYYEVVPVTIDGQTRYILDRNLAAKSAEMYVRDEYGNTALGNPDAAGGYFTIAFQQLDNNGKNTYQDPVLYDSTDDRVSPPGYRIPLKNAWGAIRTSPNFHNEAVNGKFPAYYVSDNPVIGNIYFPKSMLYMEEMIKGDARTGYYWTGTASTGTEKDEIGKWLNMFTISGSSSSYVNGCVMTNSPNLAYGASVRCINDTQDNTTTSLTSFNVTGATHVFLYKEDSNGNRTPTTAWPGHSIGNFATMTEGRWFGFSFESTQFKPEELYVIFNFVGQDGIIYSYSCNNSNGSTILTKHLTPSECVGWKVIGDDNTNIIPSESYNTIDGTRLLPSDKTALKNWWRCGVGDTGQPYVLDYKSSPRVMYMIGSATPGKWDYNNMTEINPDTGNLGLYTWEGKLTIGEFKSSFSTFRDDNFWSAYFLRPLVDQTRITEAGIKDSPMVEWKNNKPDNKWRVVTPGKYRLTFDVNKMTFSAYCMEVTPEGKVKVTVNNTVGWDNVYLYYWNSANNNYNYGNNWPGTKMIPVPDTTDQFYLEIPEFVDYIIFNKGVGGSGNQTIDIQLDGNYNFDSMPKLL